MSRPERPGAAHREPPPYAWNQAESRDFDRYLQNSLHLPAALLMENAGAALTASIRRHGRVPPCKQRILFVVGAGNNGGDALVAARHLAGDPQFECLVIAPLGLPADPHSTATAAASVLQAMDVVILQTSVPDGLEFAPDLVIDGLFGLGLNRPLEGAALLAVQALAASQAPVLAVDLPSGLDPDTGLPLGAAVAARWTLSFVAPKRGFYLGRGPEHVGTVEIAPIGVSAGFAAAWLARRRAGLRAG